MVHSIHSTGTGNSIMKENTVHFDPEHSQEVILQLTTIDLIVERNKLGKIDLLKLDVQGAELLALQGAKNTMRHVEVLMAEVSILQYNKGAPIFHKLQALLHSYDFAFWDIGHVLRTPDNRVMQFDAIWVKKSSPLWHEKCTGYPPPPFSTKYHK
jgi:hypothetical protein